MPEDLSPHDRANPSHRSRGNSPVRVVALTGGVGGARFLRGLLHHARRHDRRLDVTVVANTADDITLHGLRVCPDLDTVMYTLGGGVHEAQGWGRPEETFTVAEELTAYGDGVEWFTLGDRDVATHVHRTDLLRRGLPLSAVTERLCRRWQPGVRLLPMSDEQVETHVEVATPEGPATMHFQEWWVRHHARIPARRFLAVAQEEPRPAPGVLESLAAADVVLLPPSNPVVSIGTILGVPGVRDAIRDGVAPVVGVSPIVGGAPVRGMADACLEALGVATTAEAVAGLYADLLDAWLVDDADAALAPVLSGPWERPRPTANNGLHVVARPLLMSDLDTAADIAGAALDVALRLAAL